MSAKFSLNSLTDLLTRGALFHPDYVVTMHAVNDLSILMYLKGIIHLI